jgi:23S rRNA (uracil1939-C5)-methyltransferase
VIAPGQLARILIEKPAAGGRMIGRVEGRVVLVAGAIPGETVTAEIERVGKGLLYARTVAVDTPSPDRRTPFTDPLCGGSLYAHISYPRQLTIKQDVIADAFARIGHLRLREPPPVVASQDSGYRMRARLHVRGGRAGFFREGTHQVCDARDTRQLLPGTCDAVEQLAAALAGHGGGEIAELEIAENVDATERVVHLDADFDVGATFESIDAITGMTARPGRGSALAPPFVRTVIGSPYVTDQIDVGGQRVSFRRHVLAFFQGNRFLLHDLVAHVVAQLEPGTTAVDLYAGVGLFALSAAVGRGVRVTAVEGDHVAAEDLAFNAARSDGLVAVRRQAVESLRLSQAPLAVIADPPRTGMSREALDALLRLQSQIVVYVSCDVATLARDARRLVDAGYELREVTAFDLFPNTPHVETVAVFGRS